MQQGCRGWAPCLQLPLEPTTPRAMGMDDYHQVATKVTEVAPGW